MRFQKQKVLGFVRLARPKFLLYSWLLYSLGATLGFSGEAMGSTGGYLLGLLFIWAAHLMTHFCNEYFDLAADRANPSPTGWTGGSRVLVNGVLNPTASIGAAFVLLFFCFAIALALPAYVSWLCLLTLALGWFYTAPPLQLNYHGLGELAVTAVLNGLTPMVGFALQAGALGWDPLVVLLPAILIQGVRMMVMNLADYAGDRKVGKRTAVVLLGVRKSVWVHTWVQCAAYVSLIPAVLWLGMPLSVAVCVGLTSPLALWHVARVLRGDFARPQSANSVVFWASSHSAMVVGAAYFGVLLNSALVEQWPLFSVPGGLPGLAWFAVPPVLFVCFLGLQISQNTSGFRQPEAAE